MNFEEFRATATQRLSELEAENAALKKLSQQLMNRCGLFTKGCLCCHCGCRSDCNSPFKPKE